MDNIAKLDQEQSLFFSHYNPETVEFLTGLGKFKKPGINPQKEEIPVSTLLKGEESVNPTEQVPVTLVDTIDRLKGIFESALFCFPLFHFFTFKKAA